MIRLRQRWTSRIKRTERDAVSSNLGRPISKSGPAGQTDSGKWIARKSNRVVASAASSRDLAYQLKGLGQEGKGAVIEKLLS